MALTRICFDTSTYAHFKRGGGRRLTEIVAQADWIGFPTVVIGEILSGFLGGSRTESNVRELDEMLSSHFVSVIPIDREVAAIYAEIVSDLRVAGTPVPSNDAWIAAAAVQSGATLVTYDAHFASIRRVGSVVLARDA